MEVIRMKRGWIKEEVNSIDDIGLDDVQEDFYTLDGREKLLDNDEISSTEEGFMNGYEGVMEE